MAGIDNPNAERFATYEFMSDWPELVVATSELEERLRLHNRPIAADLLIRSFATFYIELQQLGRTMSKLATTTLIETERKTRVRPDTQGAGGERLEDHLIAEPLDPRLMPGAIGIADEEELDAAVPWWRTKEGGS